MQNPFVTLPQEEQDDFTRVFYDTFAGRLNTYAIRMEFGDKAAYMPSRYEGESEYAAQKVAQAVAKLGSPDFTEDVCAAHLAGDFLIGAYPIREDSTVLWFALDFDAKDPDDPDPYVAALNQASILKKEAGLDVYVERSQSGKGFHIWGFLDGPVNAGELRHAIFPFIESTETFDRMFPNQNGVSETRPLGNLIALPLCGSRVVNGNSTFVKKDKDGAAQPVPDQFAFVRDLKRIPVAKIKELFERAGTFTAEREHKVYDGEAEGLKDGYKVIHPLLGCEWVRWCYENPSLVDEPQWYALACNFAQLSEGRALFHEWSARDPERYNMKATDKKYDQARSKNKPHSCEVIRSLGGNCTCDQRFPGVYHPFDLARQPLETLLSGIEVGDTERGSQIAEGLDEVYEWLEAVQRDPTLGRGIGTGVPSIDRTFGMREAELTILAARNSIGKTSFTLQLGRMVAEGLPDGTPRVPVKFYSLEMTKRQVLARVAQQGTGVSGSRMQSGLLGAKDWAQLKEFRDRMADVPFYVDDQTAHLNSLLEDAARFVNAQDGMSVVVIDYLQIIPRLPRENEQDAIARSVTALKRFAKVMNCHVVLLCQLNRGADDTTGESKTYDSWLRGSGVIEFVADNILIILGEKGPGVQPRSCTIHKQRNGEAGVTTVIAFDSTTQRWGDEGAFDSFGNGLTRRPAPAVDEEEGDGEPTAQPTVEDDEEFVPSLEDEDDEEIPAPADHPDLIDFEESGL